MGQRRMLSLNIINTARFLKLPNDAQNLYFHLVLRADDDGIVEAFSVMRIVGSNEDNLKLLHVKEFVKILNEELVTFIVNWREHNLIRADRKIDSVYKELLIQVIPDIKLVEPKERADRKKDQNQDDNGTSHGQSEDGLREGKLREGKVSEDKLVSNDGTTTGRPTDDLRDERLIISNYEKLIKDSNLTRQKEILGYIEKGIDPDVINAAMFDSATAEIPKDYLVGILDKCVADKITNLQLYIDRKKEFNKKNQKRKGKVPQQENFQKREYTEEEYENFYEDVTN